MRTAGRGFSFAHHLILAGRNVTFRWPAPTMTFMVDPIPLSELQAQLAALEAMSDDDAARIGPSLMAVAMASIQAHTDERAHRFSRGRPNKDAAAAIGISLSQLEDRIDRHNKRMGKPA